jgi:thiamine-monophosphate kinase
VGLHGLIDLSDGLAGDAGHLAAASGVSLVLHEDRIPLHPGLTGDGAGDLDPMRLALEGGEDYELCLAAPSGTLDEWAAPFQDSFGIPLTKVGWVTEGEGVFLQKADGARTPVSFGGFSHFSPEEAG